MLKVGKLKEGLVKGQFTRYSHGCRATPGADETLD